MNPTRRTFITHAAAGMAVVSLPAGIRTASAADLPLNLGMASYTFREFGLDDTLAMTTRLGLGHIAFKNFHLALDADAAEIRAVAEKTRAAGLDLYGCGVVYMTSEAEVRQAFDYARAAGMRVIIGVPNHDLLPLVERMVRESDIKVAIHNHGPGDELYPGPDSVYERVSGLDPRIGLCIDIGHTMRIGQDPSEAFERYADRVLDVHIKDVSAASAEGTTVEIGRGVIDIPRFLRTLVRRRYEGIVSLEYEKDARDPLPGSAESIGYIRGSLATMA